MLALLAAAALSIPRPLPDWVGSSLATVLAAEGPPTQHIDRRDLSSFCGDGCDQYLRWTGKDADRGSIEVAVLGTTIQSVVFRFSTQRLDFAASQAGLIREGSFPSSFSVVSRTLPFVEDGTIGFQRIVIAGERGQHRWTATLVDPGNGPPAILEVDAGPAPIEPALSDEMLVLVGKSEDEMRALIHSPHSRTLEGEPARARCDVACDELIVFGPLARADLSYAPETLEVALLAGKVVSYRRIWNGDSGYFDAFVSPVIVNAPGAPTVSEDSRRWTRGTESDALYRTLEWASRGVHWKVHVLCAPIPVVSPHGLAWKASWPVGAYRVMEVDQTAKATGEPEATPSGGIVEIPMTGMGLTPTAVFQPAPRYPSRMRADGVSGKVVLEVVVDTSGAVRSVRIIQSAPGFDEAAMDAVRSWRYAPLKLNGASINWKSTITLHFQLH